MANSTDRGFFDGEGGTLKNALSSARNVLASDSAAHIVNRAKSILLLDRAIAELSVPSPNYGTVQTALLAAHADLLKVPSASREQMAIRTVARQFFDMTIPSG